MKNYLLFFLCFFSLSIQGATNDKPFVIPELQHWKGGHGTMALTDQSRVIVDINSAKSKSDKAQLLKIAEQFSNELTTLLGFQIDWHEAKGKRGDIILSLGKIQSQNQEAYAVKIKSKTTIKANQPIGVFWATRTILQMLQGSKSTALVKGDILDYPNYEMRGLMLDCGRKFFPIHFLREYVRFMAYYKMNTFQIHLNDNGMKQYYNNDFDKTYSAFRLECDTYPGLTAKDGHYTKKEFIDLQMLAEDNYVNIIPEIDAPAHVLAFTYYKPSLGSEKYGMDHFDLFNPEVYEFMDGLYDEYLSGDDPVFRGEYVHIGTDEYSNRDQKVVEKFRYFTDRYIKYIEKYGKKAAMWGALTHAKGETPVKVEDVLMLCWYNGYAQPKEMLELGYDVVSIPDGLTYIVPAAGYYYDYLNTKYLYENWVPSQIGKDKFEYPHKQIKGGMFAVWNDHQGNGITRQDVHHRVFPAMQTLSTKFWKGSEQSLDFDRFNTQRGNLTEAIGLDLYSGYGNEKGEVLAIDSIQPNEVIGKNDSGYDYAIEFNLHSKNNLNGTVLFKSRDAIVYLREPNTGKFGFEADGYTYVFDYIVPNDKTVTFKIVGDNVSTTLFVNNKEVDQLKRKWVYYSQDNKTKKADVPTLSFPLYETGAFNGLITHLKLIKY